MTFIIHRKPPYRVYIEEGSGGAMAHVAELPGCFAVGSDASRATQAVPRAITSFLSWLKSHREPLVPEAHVSRPTVADLFVAEVRSEGAPTVAGSYAALWEYDKPAWDDEKLERTLRWLTYSRADLLSRIDGMSNEELKSSHIMPDRTAWDTLWHVANAEYGYITRIAGPLTSNEITDTEPSDVRERLSAIRAIFNERARSVPLDQRDQVIYPTWANHRPDEPWTLPKAVRRALEHELEHLAELAGRGWGLGIRD